MKPGSASAAASRAVAVRRATDVKAKSSVRFISAHTKPPPPVRKQKEAAPAAARHIRTLPPKRRLQAAGTRELPPLSAEGSVPDHSAAKLGRAPGCAGLVAPTPAAKPPASRVTHSLVLPRLAPEATAAFRQRHTNRFVPFNDGVHSRVLDAQTVLAAYPHLLHAGKVATAMGKAPLGAPCL